MAHRVFVHIVFICHIRVQLCAENEALCVRYVWQLRIRMISLTRNNGHRCWTCCSNPVIWPHVNQQFIIWKCLALYCILLFRFQSNVIMCCFHTQYNAFVTRWNFLFNGLIFLLLCLHTCFDALKFYLFEWLFISIIFLDYCHVLIAHGSLTHWCFHHSVTDRHILHITSCTKPWRTISPLLVCFVVVTSLWSQNHCIQLK